MHNSLKMQAVSAIPVIRPFLSRMQLAVMAAACRGEEKEFFMQKFVDLALQINTMPKTYQQDSKGDQATVHLHYFNNRSDWYITEKDVNGGVQQAFGYAVLNGDEACAEWGYISIQKLTLCGATLGLYFAPCSLAKIKTERAGTSIDEEVNNPNPWVVVTRPGEDEESIWADFPTYKEAVAALGEPDEEACVMKRLADGTLSTDY